MRSRKSTPFSAGGLLLIRCNKIVNILSHLRKRKRKKVIITTYLENWSEKNVLTQLKKRSIQEQNYEESYYIYNSNPAL